MQAAAALPLQAAVRQDVRWREAAVLLLQGAVTMHNLALSRQAHVWLNITVPQLMPQPCKSSIGWSVESRMF